MSVFVLKTRLHILLALDVRAIVCISSDLMNNGYASLHSGIGLICAFLRTIRTMLNHSQTMVWISLLLFLLVWRAGKSGPGCSKPD